VAKAGFQYFVVTGKSTTYQYWCIVFSQKDYTHFSIADSKRQNERQFGHGVQHVSSVFVINKQQYKHFVTPSQF